MNGAARSPAVLRVPTPSELCSGWDCPPPTRSASGGCILLKAVEDWTTIPKKSPAEAGLGGRRTEIGHRRSALESVPHMAPNEQTYFLYYEVFACSSSGDRTLMNGAAR